MLILLSAVVLLPPLVRAAEGAASLSAAEIQFPGGERYEYWGSERTPSVRVVLNGQTLAASDYTVRYENNTDVGEATVTVTGAGAYTGSQTAHFTIYPRVLTLSNLQLEAVVLKEYDGTTQAAPRITANVLGQDKVEVTYTRAEYEDPYVGEGKLVRAYGIGFGGVDGDNYTLEDSSGTLEGSVGQITPQILRAESTQELAQGYTLDLQGLLSGVGEADAVFQITGDSLGCTIQGTVLTAGQASGTVQVVASAASADLNGDGKAEYAGGQVGLSLQIVERQAQPSVNVGVETGKQTQPTLSLSGATSVTYGQTLRFRATGGGGSGQVTYQVEPRGTSGQAVIDSNGLLKATQAGKVLVYAIKAGDGQYKEAKSDPVEVTIHQAQLTIQAHDRTASVGDPVPTLSSSGYTVSGLVPGDTLVKGPVLSYASTPDLSRAGTYSIQISGAAAPEGGNYRSDILYVPGTLTVSERPLYSITLRSPLNGTLTADLQAAAQGTTVTLTAQPAGGFQLKSLTAASGTTALRLQEKGAGIYTFTMPDGAVTVSAVFEEIPPETPTLPFTDVAERDWYYEDVAYAYAKGLMAGTGPATFQPNASTTRGMIVTILYRLEGSPAGASWSPFGDVPWDTYYSAPIAWAAWNGIVTGYSATSFGPEDPITREQMAAILYRYAGFKGSDTSLRGDLTQFTDADKIAAYAKDPLAWANGLGLIQGKGKGILDPGGPATRAEVAAILHRFCERFSY